MRRREFITLLGGAAAWPLAARAQQQTVVLVGLLTGSGQDDRWLGALRQGLRETGYIEGRNLAIKHGLQIADKLLALADEVICLSFNRGDVLDAAAAAPPQLCGTGMAQVSVRGVGGRGSERLRAEASRLHRPTRGRVVP